MALGLLQRQLQLGLLPLDAALHAGVNPADDIAFLPSSRIFIRCFTDRTSCTPGADFMFVGRSELSSSESISSGTLRNRPGMHHVGRPPGAC